MLYESRKKIEAERLSKHQAKGSRRGAWSSEEKGEAVEVKEFYRYWMWLNGKSSQQA